MTQERNSHPDMSPLFVCEARRRLLSRQECYDDHKDVNAKEQQTSPCYQCFLGDNLRRYVADLPRLQEPPRRIKSRRRASALR